MDKDRLRTRVWDELEESGVARFPFPPHDRIPNFAGADQAADRVTELSIWQEADVIKANPDAPQLPLRRQALREDKTVFMAVPRLRDERCFLKLDPAQIEDVDTAATVSGMDEYGTQVKPQLIEQIDLIIVGSVAVNQAGARLGKGEGYSDLEFALLKEVGAISEAVSLLTTVHECQVREESIDQARHDVPLDLIVTPERVMRVQDRTKRPSGIVWAELTSERIAEIPILQQFAEERET